MVRPEWTLLSAGHSSNLGHRRPLVRRKLPPCTYVGCFNSRNPLQIPHSTTVPPSQVRCQNQGCCWTRGPSSSIPAVPTRRLPGLTAFPPPRAGCAVQGSRLLRADAPARAAVGRAGMGVLHLRGRVQAAQLEERERGLARPEHQQQDTGGRGSQSGWHPEARR